MKKLISLLLCAMFVAGAAVSCGTNEEDYGDPLTYKYDYDLSEYIDLAEYKGLPAEGYHYEVTDEDMEQQILATRSYYSRLTDVTDRGAEYGDTVYIDYVGTIDGEEFEGGSEEDCELTLGTGTFTDEFEAAIIGAYPETELSVDLTFPDPYPASPEYAGVSAHFEISVHEVCEQELPDYNDDFVRAYLGYDSIKDFEAGLRERMEQNYQDLYYQYIIGQLWTPIVDGTTVKKYPETETETLYNDLLTSEKLYAQTMGLDFGAYLEVYYQMTEDEFNDYVREDVESRVKEEMICYAIARAENINLTEEEYENRALEYATDHYGLDSVEAMEAIYSKGSIRQAILIDMVKELIADNADVTYVN